MGGINIITFIILENGAWAVIIIVSDIWLCRMTVAYKRHGSVLYSNLSVSVKNDSMILADGNLVTVWALGVEPITDITHHDCCIRAREALHTG